MIKHFIITSLRNITKKKLLSFIQIFGLSLGIAAFILIAKYVHYEKNWDRFNTKFDRIFRVQQYKKEDKNKIQDQTSPPLADYISQNIPDVQTAITVREVWGEFLSPEPEITFYESNGFFANSDIFSVFSFQLKEGDKKTALDQPNSIILSESMAKKYFPDEKNVIGRTIRDKRKKELVVTGLMEDLPKNSHIRADYFRSIANRFDNQGINWSEQSYRTYVVLPKGIEKQRVDEQIKYLYDEHINLNKNYLYLHPLGKIHLEPDNSGDSNAVIFFVSMIGILILILAMVNFMNLSTAFSSIRSTEIGIRKTNGSGKRLITFQFLSESITLSVVAFVIALGIAFISLPYYNQVVNREITLSLNKDEYKTEDSYDNDYIIL